MTLKMHGRAVYCVADSRRIPFPDKFIHIVFTSPPYYGLRQYDTARWEGGDPSCEHWLNDRQDIVCAGCGADMIDDQIGNEGLHDCAAWARNEPPCGRCYVCNMREVFAEVWRVLRDDGVLLLNLGDSYASKWAVKRRNVLGNGSPVDGTRKARDNRAVGGLKDKDLMLVPARVALALQADGWYLRSKIVWAKGTSGQKTIEGQVAAAMRRAGIEEERVTAVIKDLGLYNGNPMTSSAQDRPASAHEEIFLLTKSPRYYWDIYATKEPLADSSLPRLMRGVGNHKNVDGAPGQTAHSMARPRGRGEGNGGTWALTGRTVRDVWTVTTSGYKGAHYATFPKELVRMGLKSAVSEKGCCPQCGAPWRRVIIKPDMTDRPMRSVTAKTVEGGDNYVNPPQIAGQKFNEWRAENPDIMGGWKPGCTCNQDGLELKPDDMEIIESPTGEAAGEDPSLVTGRAGRNRPRGENEGTRPITRHEQRAYARQLRTHPRRGEFAAQYGEAFAHWVRTDRSGARPVPHDLLERWIGEGVLERVAPPEFRPYAPVPMRVFDPFVGSGTVLEVAANEMGCYAIGTDLSEVYLRENTAVRLGHIKPEVQGADIFDLPLFAALRKE